MICLMLFLSVSNIQVACGSSNFGGISGGSGKGEEQTATQIKQAIANTKESINFVVDNISNMYTKYINSNNLTPEQKEVVKVEYNKFLDKIKQEKEDLEAYKKELEEEIRLYTKEYEGRNPEEFEDIQKRYEDIQKGYELQKEQMLLVAYEESLERMEIISEEMIIWLKNVEGNN
jgi:hypothetical protein